MIINNNNLKIYKICADDKDIPVLNNVLIKKDGSSIATNGKVFITVSPLPEKYRLKLPWDDKPILNDILINSSSVKEVIKNIPKDTTFNNLLQNCIIDSKGNFSIFNEKNRKKIIESDVFKGKYINYFNLFLKISEKSVKFSLNTQRLINLLTTVSNIIGKNNPVFFELTENNFLVIRAVKPDTEQKIIAVMKCYDNEIEKILTPDKWEVELFGKPVKKRIFKNIKLKRG